MARRRLVPSVLVTLLVAVVVTAFGAGAAPPSAPPGLSRAIAAQEAHTDALLSRAGVVGTAVGLDAAGLPVVKIYTASHALPGLPAHLDGIPTEIEPTGDLHAQAVTRPSPIGVSTGTERLTVYRGKLYCTVGTLGARVTSGLDVFALSNAHVYALEGAKTSGTVQIGASTGDKILQPGRADMPGCGSSAEMSEAFLGRLFQYIPITMSRTARNTVDAAIAIVPDGATLSRSTPPAGFGTPKSQPVAPALDMAVEKYGRTTGATTGKITGLNATVIITYDSGQARFVNQIVVRAASGAFSAGGDSGSLIVKVSDNSPVALLFAGSSTTTIGNPITAVLDAFGGGLKIDGE